MVKTEKELAESIMSGDNTIEVEGDLKDKVLKIKATGPVAWAVAIAAIIIAYGLFVASPATGGASAIASMAVAAPAVSVLGVGAFTTALLLSKAFGSTDVLDKLREYDMEKREDGIIVLRKK